MFFISNCFRNLNRIEFVITYDCTGKCRHCSEGDHKFSGLHLNGDKAAKILCDIAEKFNLTSVMTFGGEALMYPESVIAVHSAAKDIGIPVRQLITNGYFSHDTGKIKSVAKEIGNCGINDLLLSVDAFHQETIPTEPVMCFAEEVSKYASVRLNPAWLKSREDNNSCNIKTREILKKFKNLGIPESEGNIIFPEGNALINFAEYFDDNEHVNPYKENPDDIKTISIEPDGSVLSGNIFSENILKILENYNNERKEN